MFVDKLQISGGVATVRNIDSFLIPSMQNLDLNTFFPVALAKYELLRTGGCSLELLCTQ